MSPAHTCKEALPVASTQQIGDSTAQVSKQPSCVTNSRVQYAVSIATVKLPMRSCHVHAIAPGAYNGKERSTPV